MKETTTWAPKVGHGYTANNDPPPGENVHNFRGAHSYKVSTFDVAHDNGLRTALFAAKTKFDIFDQAWSDSGAPDRTGPLDDGCDKIDVHVVIGDAMDLTIALTTEMQAEPVHYTFLHYRDPDALGHVYGWGSPDYMDAINTVEDALGQLFQLIVHDPTFADKTALILSADHGGGGSIAAGHRTYDNLRDARIPFYVWGAGVASGQDLYALNVGVRYEQLKIEVLLSDPHQPFRNGDSANLAFDLLGLGPVRGSWYNFEQTIVVGLDDSGGGELDESIRCISVPLDSGRIHVYGM